MTITIPVAAFVALAVRMIARFIMNAHPGLVAVIVRLRQHSMLSRRSRKRSPAPRKRNAVASGLMLGAHGPARGDDHRE